MFCIDCNYVLVGLESRCCPECGRAFDPGDDSSFILARSAAQRLRLVHVLSIAMIACASLSLLTNLYLLIMLLIARFDLGRWPDMRGSESPHTISATRELVVLNKLLFMGALLAPIAMLGLYVAICIEGGLRWGVVRLGLVAVGLWVAGAALLWWDPLLLWNWYFD